MKAIVFGLCLASLFLLGCFVGITTGPDSADIRHKAEQFCSTAGYDNSEVFVAGPYVKIVSSSEGAGITYFKPTVDDYGEPIYCPVAVPDSLSDECREIMEITENMQEEKVC